LFIYEAVQHQCCDTVKLCQDYFDFDLPNVMIKKGRKKFLARFEIVEESLHQPVCELSLYGDVLVKI